MKGLFLKDYYCVKQYKWFLLFSFIFSLLIILLNGYPSSSGDQSEAIDGLVLIGEIIAVFVGIAALSRTMREDENSQIMKTAFSSSISRKGYMAEKYLFGIIIIVVPAVMSFLFSTIAYVLSGTFDSANYKEMLEMFVDITRIGFFFVIFMIPICICFGMRKQPMVFLVYFGISVLYLFYCFITEPDEATEKVLGNAVDVVMHIIRLTVFILGWKWIEKLEV